SPLAVSPAPTAAARGRETTGRARADATGARERPGPRRAAAIAPANRARSRGERHPALRASGSLGGRAEWRARALSGSDARRGARAALAGALSELSCGEGRLREPVPALEERPLRDLPDELRSRFRPAGRGPLQGRPRHTRGFRTVLLHR